MRLTNGTPFRWWLGLTAAGAVAACGSSAETADSRTVPQPEPASQPARPAPVSTAAASNGVAPRRNPHGALRLGHYSSPNGGAGFVLDRTAEPFLLQVDGKSEIFELEFLRNAQFGAKDYRTTGNHWLRLTPNGRVHFDQFSNNNSVQVYRDGDAEPLR